MANPVGDLDLSQVLTAMHKVEYTGLRGLVAMLMHKLDNDGLTAEEGTILEYALQESLSRLSTATS